MQSIRPMYKWNAMMTISEEFAKFSKTIDDLTGVICKPEAVWIPATLVPTSDPNYRDLQRRGLL